MTELLSRFAALQKLAPSSFEFSDSQPLADTLLKCCEQLINAGWPESALDLLDASASLEESATKKWRFARGLLRARALRYACHYEESLAFVRQLIENPQEPLSHEDGQCLRIIEGAALWQLNGVDEAVERLSAVRNELLRGPDSEILARCTVELSSAALFRGDLDMAKAYALDSLVSAKRCGCAYIEAQALANLSRVEKYLCRWGAAEEAATEAVRILEKLENRIQRHISFRALGIIAWKRGRLASALDTANQCHEDATSLASTINCGFAALLKGAILIHMGAYDAAREAIGRQPSLMKPQSRYGLLREELLGDLLLEEGRAKEALERFEAVEPGAVGLAPNGDIAAELPRRKAEAYRLVNMVEEAYALAMAGLVKCKERRDKYEEAATYRTLALSAAALGNPDKAKHWFEEGFAQYDEIETPYEWGRLWLAYGEWLCGDQSGQYADRRGATEAFLAARDHFDRIGAMRKLADVEAKIEACRAAGMQITVPEVPSEALAGFRRPQRRPRGAAELDRRSAWAKETFSFITRNKVVLDLLDDVAKLSRSGYPILVLGESGTGKDLVARGIHKLSGRSGSFMPINCSALPRDVIESELFGHVAGAFTGATRDKVGLFEACQLGTVFLDEIAEMSLDLQTRLLRFLESGEFRRVGSTKNVAVDTLIVAATNRNRTSLESGEGFRSDLYYRLAHAVVVLPPLRRRGEDVSLLIDHFLTEACERQGKQVTLSTAARNQLIAHSWPGNVRQLRSAINRLVALGSHEHPLGPESVELDEGQAPANLSEELVQAERRRIVEALAAANGVRTEAAKVLGLSRTTLIGKMQRYGIR